jgi:integrase/recombinase XerD
MPEQTSPLRQRMIDDMSLRNMAALTQAAYIRAVKNFSKHFGKSPDKLTFEDVRQYQLSLVGRGLGPQAVNQIMCALRFFYKTTMGIKDAHEHIALARRSDPLPAILSRDEVGRFLQAAHSGKYRIAFATIYATGLRVSELISLTVKDIDSGRMVIHVRQGKGRKDRYVMLSEQLLDLLRSYWKIDRPAHWLFPGADPQRHITARRSRASRLGKGLPVRCSQERSFLRRLAHSGCLADRIAQPAIRAGDKEHSTVGLGSQSRVIKRQLLARIDRGVGTAPGRSIQPVYIADVLVRG